MTKEDKSKSELDRLMRELAALDEKASKIEEQAEIIARARSGPKYGPEGSRQSGYIHEKQKAVMDLTAKYKHERDAINEKIAEMDERDKSKGQERTIDMTALQKAPKEAQKAAIALALGKDKGQEQGADRSKTLTQEFNKQAQRETAQNDEKGKNQEQSIDTSALQNAAIALALGKNKGQEQNEDRSKTLTQEFNKQADRD